MAFSSDQQAEINRMSSERQALLSDDSKGNDEDGNALPTALERLEARSVAELKCRVNILGLGADSVTYAPENNYSTVEQGVINAVVPTQWMKTIPVLLSDAQVLRDGGMAEASILAMLQIVRLHSIMNVANIKLQKFF